MEAAFEDSENLSGAVCLSRLRANILQHLPGVLALYRKRTKVFPRLGFDCPSPNQMPDVARRSFPSPRGTVA